MNMLTSGNASVMRESDLEWLYSLALPLFNNGSGVADELEGCSEGRVVCVVEDESSVS